MTNTSHQAYKPLTEHLWATCRRDFSDVDTSVQSVLRRGSITQRLHRPQETKEVSASALQIAATEWQYVDGIWPCQSQTGTNIPGGEFTQRSDGVTLHPEVPTSGGTKDFFPEIACECVVSSRVFTATFSRTRCAPPRKLFLCFSCLQGQQTYYDPLQSDTESLAGYDSSAESGLGDKIWLRQRTHCALALRNALRCKFPLKKKKKKRKVFLFIFTPTQHRRILIFPSETRYARG